MLQERHRADLAVAIGAVGYSYWTRKDAEESPINVMVTQMRTRAIIEHERQRDGLVQGLSGGQRASTRRSW